MLVDDGQRPLEMFRLRRRGVEFAAKDSMGQKLKGKGEVFVTSARLVFVSSSGSGGMGAFDIPLANLRDEKFNQPIFGANNLSGVVQAMVTPTAGVTGAVEFKIYFNEGGCSTFLTEFFNVMERSRACVAQAVPVATPVRGPSCVHAHAPVRARTPRTPQAATRYPGLVWCTCLTGARSGPILLGAVSRQPRVLV